MESKKDKKRFGFLPVYFKKIGLAVIVLSVVPGLISRAMVIHHTPIQREIWYTFSFNALLLGLLFIALSRDKIEDEMTVSLRLKAMAFSFVWCVGFVIVKPFFDLLVDKQIDAFPAQELVLSLLFFYLLTYYLQKLGR